MVSNQATEPPQSAARNVSRTRGIAAATIGNALEWFDMTIYALLAIYIGHNFFPSESESIQLIQTFAVFGVSYLVRPLGGLIIGSYSDRNGLKKGLMLTIRLMVVGTALIAFMPGHDKIGILAPLGIILARLIQGFSAGGEFGAATSFLIAQNGKRRGFFGSFQFASQGLGITFAAIFVAGLTAVLNEDDMNSWGWRIPFIFGLLVGPVGYIIRRVVNEVPIDRDPSTQPQPIRDLFRTQKLSIVIAGGSLAISTALNFTMQYMPTYGIKQLGLSQSTSFISLVITGAILTFATPLVGHLSDRYGRLNIMIPAAIVIAVTVIPLFIWLIAAKSFLVLCLVMIALGAMKAAYFGALPSVMSDAFPVHTRATGLSFSYNTTVAIFGGFTPMVTAFLIQATGQPVAPGYYLALLAGISIIALVSGFKFRAIR
ncbi:major facilitator superfamily protein [Rhodococcus opacus]|uniref:Major facilitator superfamily protein n=2 Tax=Rhodococcus opacus TaxID=37919 RepID=A0A1B1KEW1_RHOOP|nr:MFS transporter [Rhodococcus opacus]ANS31128.1 major facilitator superfamily protein [Rhodococcus opacus]